jgi:type VI secretion system protein ImpK
MISATLDPQPPRLADGPAAAARGELALALQEAFTVAVRLRSNRQVAADAASFRAQVKQLLTAADQRARAAGYDGDTVKRAVYAFIALLDESVLNSPHPMFAEWSRQPLQEEVFGEHMAGENFFRALHELLAQQDSHALGDLLEVYQLCLLLGFRGRYGAGDPGGLHAVITAVQTKLQRIRGVTAPDLAPDWRLPAHETVTKTRDPITRRLAFVAAGTLLLAVVVYVIYRALLASGMAELRSLV